MIMNSSAGSPKLLQKFNSVENKESKQSKDFAPKSVAANCWASHSKHWGETCDTLAFHPRAVQTLLVISCHIIWDTS